MAGLPHRVRVAQRTDDEPRSLVSQGGGGSASIKGRVTTCARVVYIIQQSAGNHFVEVCEAVRRRGGRESGRREEFEEEGMPQYIPTPGARTGREATVRRQTTLASEIVSWGGVMG